MPTWLARVTGLFKGHREVSAFHNAGIAAVAAHVGKDWVDGSYYDEAEQALDSHWDIEVWDFIKDCDFGSFLDLAAGHGRNTNKLASKCGRIVVVDINETNIQFCRRRFGNGPRFTYIRNNGYDLSGVPDNSITLLFCYDAMVHFDSDIVRAYLKETRRVLVSGGHAFFHYSNYQDNPEGDVHDNPGWRNFMSIPLFRHYAHKEGLEVLTARTIRPEEGHRDAVSLLRKP